MDAPLPEVPDIGWFELEILYLLWDKQRYGNEMRAMLNRHLGENTISTGKLYPVLKKLERSGYIRKLKKKTKEKIIDGDGMTTRLLTRGVDRIYFEITEEGKNQVECSISFSDSMSYNVKMEDLNSRARPIIKDLVRSMGEDAQVGIIIPNTKRGVIRARSLLPDLDPRSMIHLLMPTKKSQKIPFGSEDLDLEINSFLSKFEDIPLKEGYLDAVVSLIHLQDVPSKKKYFIELVRTLKPKGILIVVDIEKLDSILLETILSDNVEYDGEGPFTGEDIDELITVLEGKLRNIKISTVKELFVLHGHRSKSSR